MANLTTTPTTTPNPTVTPIEKPWHEEFTDAKDICEQQKRELSSPDVEP